MDAKRFERVVRVLTTSRSRRQALRGVGAVLLGGWLARDPAMTTAKGKKGKSKRKNKGKKKTAACRPQCTGRACADDGCGGSCGACGTVPCRDVCQGGACLSANDSRCNGSGRCLNGICNPDPLCGAGGLSLGTAANPGFCCSNVCTDGICAPGNQGDACRVRTDCNGVGCVGFRCH